MQRNLLCRYACFQILERIVSLTMRDCQISMPLQSVPINSEKLFLNIDRVGVPTINDRVGLG